MKHVKASIAVAFGTFTMPLPATPSVQVQDLLTNPQRNAAPVTQLLRTPSPPPICVQFLCIYLF